MYFKKVDNNAVLKAIKEKGQLQRFLEVYKGLQAMSRRQSSKKRYNCPICNDEKYSMSLILNSRSKYDVVKCHRCGFIAHNTFEAIQGMEGLDFIPAINLANELLGNKHYQEQDFAFNEAIATEEEAKKLRRLAATRNGIKKQIENKQYFDKVTENYLKNRGILAVAKRVNEVESIPLTVTGSTYNGKSSIYYDFKKPNQKITEGFCQRKDPNKVFHPTNMGLEVEIAFLKPQKHNKLTICEGVETALTNLQYGANVCCLNGVGNVTKLIDKLKQAPSKYKGIIFNIQLDADEAGQKGTDKLIKAFKEMNLSYEIDPIVSQLYKLQKRLNNPKITDFNDMHVLRLKKLI